MTFKQMEVISKMFTNAINQHGDSLRTADFDWYIVELYDARYNDGLIQHAVPWCRLDFK